MQNAKILGLTPFTSPLLPPESIEHPGVNLRRGSRKWRGASSARAVVENEHAGKMSRSAV